MSRNQRSIKKKLSYGVLGVSRLQMPDFPTPILATCLKSVIAPKQVDRFLCSLKHLLAFLKLYMIHVKNSEIDQIKPSYGVLGVSRLQMPDFPTPISTTCLWSIIAPKRIDWFLCDWWHLLAFLKLYMIHVNRSKIDQEKAKLWDERELFSERRLKKSDFSIPILTSCL